MIESDIPPKDRPWHMILIVAGVAMLLGVIGISSSLGYSAGSRASDKLQTQINAQTVRLTNQNRTINNQSVAIKIANQALADNARVSACRQHVSDFEKIMDSNVQSRLVAFIGLVVNKPPGVDLATNPKDVAALVAYEQAATDYQRSVLAPKLCV